MTVSLKKLETYSRFGLVLYFQSIGRPIDSLTQGFHTNSLQMRDGILKL